MGGPEAYSFPTGPAAPAIRLSFVDAVRAPIFPAVVAERVLAAWSRGEPLPEWASEVDPRHERRRGAAVVLSGDRMLLIRYAPAARDGYFIPGGSVEPGETPAVAAVRELKEETGLVGTVDRLLATVLNRSREEHYHVVAIGSGEPTPLDLAPGQTLEWVPDRGPAAAAGLAEAAGLAAAAVGRARLARPTARPRRRHPRPAHPVRLVTPAATSGTAGGCRGRSPIGCR